MRNNPGTWFATLMIAAAVLLTPAIADAQTRREARPREAAGSESDFAASRLLQRAQDLLLANENDRGVKMLETILDQYPSSNVRYQVYIALGEHYMDTNNHLKAINYLRHLKQLNTRENAGEEEMSTEERDLYLEGLYLTGVSYFEMRQYGSAFPVLRKITSDFPNTVWANQAYYYIGMCHFAQSNWTKAIEALTVVGTFVDPSSESTQYVEAGRRFYVKISDADLPVLHRLGREVKLEVAAASGDAETITLIPLSEKADIFIGSIPTELGAFTAGDDRLQVVGGDTISTRYVDSNTMEGESNKQRTADVRVVSTGSITFTLGDFTSRAEAAFIGQPVFVQLHDADLDSTANADAVEVRVISRYEEQEEEDESGEGGLGINIERLFEEDQVKWVVRDEVVLKLSEIGETPVRTGRFNADLKIDAYRQDQSVSTSDDLLTVAIGDQIVASYIDTMHIAGEDARQLDAAIRVVSEIDGKPRPVQYVVPDPVVRSQKNLVEAEAYLELGRIFKSMGLMDGAAEKCDEGITRVDDIIRLRSPLPRELVEQAFKLKWELYLVKDNLTQAIATCQMFNRLYPDSPFVDQALLKIGMIKFEQKEYDEAINIFGQILRLNTSNAKAEAQFRIAEAREEMSGSNARYAETAIEAYKTTAERYPDSEYAGVALGKLVDYYIRTKDYAQANDLLGQIFEDYPDADFLDSMLLKWVMVAYRMGNLELAHEKCSELIFEYPSSRFAERAKIVLTQIEARMNQTS